MHEHETGPNDAVRPTGLDRRTFLGAAVGGVLSMAAATAADTNAAKVRIVDTHQHLWDLEKQKLSWLGGAPEILKHSYRTAEYREAIAGLGAEVRTVYMEVDVVPEETVLEADLLIALARGGTAPTVAAVLGGRPADPGFAKYLDRFRGVREVKGIRQVLHVDTTPQGTALSEAYVRGVRELGTRGLSFDLCLRPTELNDGVKLAELCPDTRFVVDHCGNADPKAFLSAARKAELKVTDEPWHGVDVWKKSMEALAARPNVICKISGIIARAPQGWNHADLAPIVNHCLDTFGPERVVFGSDWPVCLLGGSLQQWVEALRTIVAGRPASDRDRLWFANAEKFYTLPPA